MKFEINDFFETKEGNKCKIIGTLGQGAQGHVYLVDYDGKQYALKIYKENPSQEFKNNIFNNIHTESPSENFLWPKVSFEWGDGTFGCLMDLIPNTYSSFISYLNGKTNFKNLVTKLNWCIELANSFKALHEKGYTKDMVSMQGLGYKEILDYLNGEISLDRAVYLIKRDTRHFAKRQLTWFRREKEVEWVNKPDLDYDNQKIIEYMLTKLKEKDIL